MAMYLCRWPNGEFSIVNAATKDDAIVMLDEWGNAEQASLKRMPDCMFDFRLRDDGESNSQILAKPRMTSSWKPAIPSSTRPSAPPSGKTTG
jgi:hypothetical protein